MTPTPESLELASSLELCVTILRNPELPWQWHGIGMAWQDGERACPFVMLSCGAAIRIHPDYQAPAPKSWEATGFGGLYFQDEEGKSCFGAVHLDDAGFPSDPSKESFRFWRNGGLFSLHKESGKVTKLSQTEV